MTAQATEREKVPNQENREKAERTVGLWWRDEVMKRALLGVVVLAVCGMMIAPAAIAGGKPKGEPAKLYSTIADDFSAGPTQGEWNYAGRVHWAADGGSITIKNVPESVSETGELNWDTHTVSLLMGSPILNKNGAPSQISPHRLDVGEYECPGDVISSVSFYVQLTGWGPDGQEWLTAGLYTHINPLEDGTKISIERTDNQLILSGTDIPFTYHDWLTESIRDPPEKYGTTTHTFTITIDL
jgi:hypothetical protein